MSSAEFTRWRAYELVTGPLGPARTDVMLAIVAATIANAAGNLKDPLSPEQVIPDWDQVPKSRDEQVADIYNQWSALRR